MKNPIKIIYISCALVAFHFAGYFNDDIKSYNIEQSLKIKDTYVYIYQDVNNNKIEYKNICSDKPIDYKDNKIIIKSYSVYNIMFWVFFSIFVILLLVTTFTNDDDYDWETDACYQEAFSSLIYCEKEDDLYYYFALGRLIEIRKTQISKTYTASGELRIDGFSNLYRCPKYETKKQRRETLLKKIGI